MQVKAVSFPPEIGTCAPRLMCTCCRVRRNVGRKVNAIRVCQPIRGMKVLRVVGAWRVRP